MSKTDMDVIKCGLEEMFDSTLPEMKHFQKKSYKTLFEAYFEKYRPIVKAVSKLCESASETEREEILDELAQVIPNYAYEMVHSLTRKKSGSEDIDYNMNMAIYVIPLLTYTRDEYCQELAKRTVRNWNRKKISTLHLKVSSYETIASGFEKRIFGLRIFGS